MQTTLIVCRGTLLPLRSPKASLVDKRQSTTLWRRNRSQPMIENNCIATPLTRSTSVVIKVIICALLEDSLSCSVISSPGTASSELSSKFCVTGSRGAAEEAISFLAKVLAKRTVLSSTLMRVCRRVVDSHNCSISRRSDQSSYAILLCQCTH